MSDTEDKPLSIEDKPLSTEDNADGYYGDDDTSDDELDLSFLDE